MLKRENSEAQHASQQKSQTVRRGVVLDSYKGYIGCIFAKLYLLFKRGREGCQIEYLQRLQQQQQGVKLGVIGQEKHLQGSVLMVLPELAVYTARGHIICLEIQTYNTHNTALKVFTSFWLRHIGLSVHMNLRLQLLIIFNQFVILCLCAC